MKGLSGTILFFLSGILSGQNIAIPNVSWGKLNRFAEFSSAFIGKRCVDVLLPESYHQDSSCRFPVLYMHDGQMLFDSTLTWNHQEWKIDESLANLFRQSGKSCIVVAIHNAGTGRYAEYFPQKPFEALSPEARKKVLSLAQKDPNRRMAGDSPHSDDYLRFLTGELKPFIDAKYRSKADAAHNWIAGSSMGGLISLYGLTEYPEVFGAAACLSTHWTGIFENKENPVPEAFISYLKNSLKNKGQRIYLITGTEGLDSLYSQHHRKAGQLLQNLLAGKNQVKIIAKKGAGHSERDWQQQMPSILEFLFEMQ